MFWMSKSCLPPPSPSCCLLLGEMGAGNFRAGSMCRRKTIPFPCGAEEGWAGTGSSSAPARPDSQTRGSRRDIWERAYALYRCCEGGAAPACAAVLPLPVPHRPWARSGAGTLRVHRRNGFQGERALLGGRREGTDPRTEQGDVWKGSSPAPGFAMELNEGVFFARIILGLLANGAITSLPLAAGLAGAWGSGRLMAAVSCRWLGSGFPSLGRIFGFQLWGRVSNRPKQPTETPCV